MFIDLQISHVDRMLLIKHDTYKYLIWVLFEIIFLTPYDFCWSQHLAFPNLEYAMVCIMLLRD